MLNSAVQQHSRCIDDRHVRFAVTPAREDENSPLGLRLDQLVVLRRKLWHNARDFVDRC